MAPVGAGTSSDLTTTAKSLAPNGVVLSETQLGNMALRAKQQRTKAEQDKQLLQVGLRGAGKKTDAEIFGGRRRIARTSSRHQH